MLEIMIAMSAVGILLLFFDGINLLFEGNEYPTGSQKFLAFIAGLLIGGAILSYLLMHLIDCITK